jgi:hypothetical protein
LLASLLVEFVFKHGGRDYSSREDEEQAFSEAPVEMVERCKDQEIK